VKEDVLSAAISIPVAGHGLQAGHGVRHAGNRFPNVLVGVTAGHLPGLDKGPFVRRRWRRRFGGVRGGLGRDGQERESQEERAMFHKMGRRGGEINLGNGVA
jgi:hypothetical protein